MSNGKGLDMAGKPEVKELKEDATLMKESYEPRKKTGLSSGFKYLDYVTAPDYWLPSGTITEVGALSQAGKSTLLMNTIAYNMTINPEFKST